MKRYSIVTVVMCAMLLVGCTSQDDNSAEVYRGLSWTSTRSDVEKTMPGGTWTNHTTETQDIDIYQVLNVDDHAENFTFYDEDDLVDSIDLAYVLLEDDEIDPIYSSWVETITEDYGATTSEVTTSDGKSTVSSWDLGETYVSVSKTNSDLIKEVRVEFSSKKLHDTMRDIVKRQLDEG